MWDKIRESVGRLWGATTTLVLAISVAVLPILQGLDPEFVHAHPAIMWATMLLGIISAAARVIAPPPPSVPIHTGDAVDVDRVMGTVMVTKAAEIPASVVSKAAGEKV
jgi:hypothetical protein